MAIDDSTHDDYLTFCAGILDITGIDLRQYKRQQMERRVRSFVEHKGYPTLRRYLTAVGTDVDALHAFLDRITINVSQLFRNPEQWKFMADTIIPELAKSGTINAWSAGCSYGAEAYSLAAVCKQVAPGTTVKIRGSDIDDRVLEAAREGWFSEEDARTAPPEVLDRWFTRERSGWLASDQLRSMTTFRREDLLKVQPPANSFNLVLCRNVVIYFTNEARDVVHTTLARACATGGYVVIGSTERITLPIAVTGLRTVQPFVYKKEARQ